MARLFGTDGVRGLANDTLTPDLALRLGAAAAAELTAHLSPQSPDERPIALVGRDPRRSGHMLEAALVAGLTSRGVDVELLGVLPTPAVAYLTGARGAALGVMISASHNAMPDNGIKFFSAGGHKLPDTVEDAIEQRMSNATDPGPTGAGIGSVRDASDDALEQYLTHLAASTPADLSGLTVVVDAAHGAAATAAPEAYERAGATVIRTHCAPDGININDGCGSTHLEPLQHAVREHGADLGLAHDGDADRCLAVDAQGNVVDGDQIMAVLALAMKEAGTLADNTLIATVMSNLGLRLALTEAGVDVKTTKVGDRYVLQSLREGNFSLGGEQSGHIVVPEAATTGDGTLTGLRIMQRMAQTRKSLADLAAVMTVLPQVLINVRVADKTAVAEATAVRDAVARAESELGETGRVLLRPSGTEPLVRVMVEAADEETAQRVAKDIAEVVGQQ